MTSAPYLDRFLDSLKELPAELHQNFTQMRELDSRAQQVLSNIDKMADNCMKNVKNNETMTSIQSQFDTAKGYSDDKVQLSIQTYELVDKHIRKLDADLARFEAEIQFKAAMRDAAINITRNLNKGGSKMTIASPSKTLSSVGAVTNLSNPTSSILNVAVETSSLTGELVGAGVAHSAETDMPIDPNEPTFCVCKQVSFGKMICCDDSDCPIEWFHFDCVNLTTKPKGKWFCPKCKTDMKEKK